MTKETKLFWLKRNERATWAPTVPPCLSSLVVMADSWGWRGCGAVIRGSSPTRCLRSACETVRGSLLSALQAQHRTPKPPALMRGKNVKAFWLPELFNQNSISVSEPEKWLESSGLPEILSDCDCGMKWALCGVAAAAKFEMCSQKAIWEIIGCEFVTRVSKTSDFKWKRCDGLRIWIGVRWCSDLTSLWWPCSKIQSNPAE